MENDFSIIAKFVLSEDFLPSQLGLRELIADFINELNNRSLRKYDNPEIEQIPQQSQNLRAEIENIIEETEKLTDAFIGAEAAIIPHDELGNRGKQELEGFRKEFESELAAIKKAETTEIDNTKERFEKRIAGLSDAVEIKKEEALLKQRISSITESFWFEARNEARRYLEKLHQLTNKYEIKSPSNQRCKDDLIDALAASFDSLDELKLSAIEIERKLQTLREQVDKIPLDDQQLDESSEKEDKNQKSADSLSVSNSQLNEYLTNSQKIKSEKEGPPKQKTDSITKDSSIDVTSSSSDPLFQYENLEPDQIVKEFVNLEVDDLSQATSTQSN